ncbi:hypothetical protein ID866_11930 [Astraeus odoratus]|nr:hypothetical protein ID866_11930 [Astraeus odoratus]
MSTSNKNVKSMNWQELQEKYWHKWVQEAEEVKKCQEVEEAEKWAHKAEEAKKRWEAEQQREAMVQVVDRRMGEVVAELQGLRKGMSNMAKANWELARVLYQGFQSINMLVDEVKIFRAEGYLPKPALESKASEDELQETLWEVDELQEEHLEWAMECLQMRKEWMWQEEATLTKCLKGKGKELAKEKEQEEEEQGARGEGGEGVAA